MPCDRRFSLYTYTPKKLYMICVWYGDIKLQLALTTLVTFPKSNKRSIRVFTGYGANLIIRERRKGRCFRKVFYRKDVFTLRNLFLDGFPLFDWV